MSLLKVNEIQIFNGTTVTITATTTETSADLNVGADLDVTGALTLGTALAIAEGGTGAADAATARTNLDVDQAGTDNSTDVSLVTTSHDYLSITGQAITLGAIDLTADVTGTLPVGSGGTGATALSSLNAADLGSGVAADGYVLTADGTGGAAWEAKAPIDLLSSGASIRKSDGTTTVLSESGGAVTLENTSLGDTVLMPDNSNNVSTAPGIRFEADTDTGIGLASAGNLAIVTGGSERMRIDSSGNVELQTTNANLILPSGGGISFNPYADSSDIDSNILQDYETGTFAPTFTCETNPASLTVTYDGSYYGGIYIKIGHLVYVQIFIRTDSVSVGSPAASGNLYIEDLPFAPYNRENYDRLVLTASYPQAWASNAPLFAYNNGSRLYLVASRSSSGAATLTQVSDMNTGANQNWIGLCGTYWTNS